jgi:hypothetical protein
LLSCSKEKDTLTHRIYHSTTSYFNWYYNADRLFDETVGLLETQYRFPEQGFMEVVYYGTPESVQSLIPDLEKVNEKNDAVMFKHPNGNFIDECRLLNGKSWFYRQNYRKALKNLRVVIDSFPGTEHATEAWFWTAQTQYQKGNQRIARDLIQKHILNVDSAYLSDEATGELGIFLTKLDIEEENYDRAVKTLEAYLPYVEGRLRKARAHYLMGQLYAQIEAYPQALEQFDLVSKYSTNYDLTFSAKMKTARMYVRFQEGKDDDQEVQKYLTKLLKDEKNADYLDRIYYEFALLAIKKDELPGAIDYLNQSIRTNRSDQRQKALSYYKIGKIYFDDYQDYDKAQAYYDSAASAITPQAPEYKEITGIAATLKDYITYKRTIAFQDSMIYLASLPEAELDTLINQLAREEERLKKEEAQRLLDEQASAQQYNALDPNAVGGARNQTSGGQWYFDNQQAVSQGRIQFEQKWGKRVNEDNWRRKNKQTQFGAREQQIAQAEAQQNNAPVDSAMLEKYGKNYKYYQNIPQGEEAIAAANGKIEAAIYKLGQLYSQKLNEPDSAIKTFENLLSRYQDSEYVLQARYALYKMFFERQDSRFSKHRDYILREHPNTVYAYLIMGKDPKELEKDEEDFRFVYNGLFESYAREDYETCVGFSSFLLSQERFRDNPEIDMARLLFIRGMSYGYLEDKDSLRIILTKVVNGFPESPVTPRAEQVLNYLLNGLPAKRPEVSEATGEPEGPKAGKEAANFKGFTDEIKANEKVYALIYIEKGTVPKAELEAAISDFNRTFHDDKNLRVNVFLYQNTHLLPYISSFENKEQAQNYLKGLLNYPQVRDQVISRGGQAFFISHSNFRVAYSQKRMTDYLQYYQQVLGGGK